MPVTPPRERTRREIEHHAMLLFAQRGYEATSLQDIATAVGCSKATVLYHFNGKPAVLAAALAPSAAALDTLVHEARRLPRGAAQQHAISGFIDLAVRSRGLVSVLYGVWPTFAEEPAFSSVVAAGEQLCGLLAGNDDPRERAVAAFAVKALLTECRLSDQYSDDELRAVCDTALSRLLRPAG